MINDKKYNFNNLFDRSLFWLFNVVLNSFGRWIEGAEGRPAAEFQIFGPKSNIFKLT